jgi:histidyl-tRNA synthetase
MSKKQLLLQAPKGMHDVLPGDAVVWDKVRAAVRHIADTYGFSRIETPTLEAAELYERGTGVDTDVVTKTNQKWDLIHLKHQKPNQKWKPKEIWNWKH